MDDKYSIELLFNTHKMKYIEMDNYFNFDIKEKKTIYFFLDFDYIFSKYLYNIDYRSHKDMEITTDMTNEFLTEFLNLISHYKSYFYNKCDTISFFYITISVTKYKKDKNVSNMIKFISKLLMVIPRIYIIFNQSQEECFFLKYQLMLRIKANRIKSGNRLIFLDMSKCDNSELYFKISKDYHKFEFEHYKIKLYGFECFRYEHLSNVEDVYINSVISLLTIYNILEVVKVNKKFRIDDIILKYIKDNTNKDFNDISTKLLILKMFSNMKYLEKRFIKLEKQLSSPLYGIMIETIMNNWKRTIKDNSILKINEMLKPPKNKRINIELLMNS